MEAARSTATVIGRPDIPGRLVRVELRGQVSYSDLDLSIDSNANVLKQRVRDAARTVCSDLDKVYHLHESVSTCATRAEHDAMAQVGCDRAGSQEGIRDQVAAPGAVRSRGSQLGFATQSQCSSAAAGCCSRKYPAISASAASQSSSSRPGSKPRL